MSFQTTPASGCASRMSICGPSDRTFVPPRAAFEEHSLLLLPDQQLVDADHVRLAQYFAPIEDRHADERPDRAAFEVPPVTNIGTDGSLNAKMNLHILNLKSNMLWHSDSTFLPTLALTKIPV